MKKILSVFLVSVVANISFSQQDTIYMTPREVADSLFALKNITSTPTGKLFNRMFLAEEESTVGHFYPGTSDTANADYFYLMLNEMESMAFDSSQVIGSGVAFDIAFDVFARDEYYEEGYTVIPLAFLDFEYDILPFEEILGTGLLDQDIQNINPSYFSLSQLETRRATILAPTIDFISEETLHFILPSELIITDREISTIEISIDGNWQSYRINELIPFNPEKHYKQSISMRLIMDKGDTSDFILTLLTPELSNRNRGYFDCGQEYYYEGSEGVRLNFCVKYGCGDQVTGNKIDKPFILVTGYRPPMFSQSYEKTWEIYSSFHNGYLENLVEQDFDVVLVRNNMHLKPNKLGIIEYSDLLIELIKGINIGKEIYGSDYENVIQGCSMGADAVNLALLQMEKAHHENGAKHHHTRLFISYDANYYGANVPLTFQLLVKNHCTHRDPLLDTYVANTFLLWFMNKTIDGKSFRQLVRYHAEGVHKFPTNLHIQRYFTPDQHQYRSDIISLQNTLNRKGSFVPLPESTRNIAVSLGAIRGTNDNVVTESNRSHAAAGEEFSQISGFGDMEYAFAKYDPNFHFRLARRRSFYGGAYVPFMFSDQGFHVNSMLEIDNASGSYLDGFGNFVEVFGLALFGPSAGLHQRYATHKPVVSSLAINPNLWTSNGSMTLDMQNLGLMYNNFESLENETPSDFYGYPHIGRPDDYTQVTPFDAIYVDNQIDPHIKLEESDHQNELTDFLYNEIEPWYLYLQNQEIGSQARPDYRYKAKRRARNMIIIGSEMTASTPKGTYIVKANADLTLRAGEAIELGYTQQQIDDEVAESVLFDIEPGGTIDVYIDFELCNSYKNLEVEESSQNQQDATSYVSLRVDENVGSLIEDVAPKLLVIPNPTLGEFMLRLEDNSFFDNFMIYQMNGMEVVKKVFSPVHEIRVSELLQKGTYLVIVSQNGQRYHQKLVVL